MFARRENEFQGWKDYFILIYGVLNVFVLSYFIITFIVSVVRFICINM